MQETQRQKVIEYLRPRAAQITDEESEALAKIRELWATLSPTVRLGMISELTSALYQETIR